MSSAPASVAPARSRNARGEGARLREELLDAARRLLDRGTSESALSLRAVAREAGVAAPSSYAHFASRDDLIVAVLEELFGELTTRLVAAGRRARSPESRLRPLCLAYCAYAAKRPGRYRALFSRTWRAPARYPVESFPGWDAFTVLVQAIEQTGDRRPGDALEAAVGVWVALHGIVTLRQSLPRFPWPPLERQIDDVLRRTRQEVGR